MAEVVEEGSGKAVSVKWHGGGSGRRKCRGSGRVVTAHWLPSGIGGAAAAEEGRGREVDGK